MFKRLNILTKSINTRNSSKFNNFRLYSSSSCRNRSYYLPSTRIYPSFVNIIEVGPRDGLQNEKKILSVPQKLAMINGLIECGIKNIEVGSFVNPKKVPSMADTPELINHLPDYPDLNYSVLVPNSLKYFQYVKSSTKLNEIVLFVAASETFNKKNINCDSKEAFKKFEEFVKDAKSSNFKIRGSISCTLGCPYEGDVNDDLVLDIVKRYIDLGVDQIDLADTIGVGDPHKLDQLLKSVQRSLIPSKLTGHFHETYNRALELVNVSMLNGVDTFHSSIAGLGGCPFSKKIVGNLSTEKLIYYLHTLGVRTNVDEEKVNKMSKWVQTVLKE